MHVDPIHARRLLFGEPVVHGIHLVLWALDAWVAQHGPRRLTRVAATFRKPLFVGHEVEVELGPRLVARAGDAAVMELSLESADGAHSDPPLEDHPFQRAAAHELTWPELANAVGDTPLARDRLLLAALFPALAPHPHVQLCELLAATRIVGMACPGLHSIFSRLDLAASPRAEERVTYRVQKAVEKYSIVQVAFTGPTLAGALDTFVRPRPVTIELAPGRVPIDLFRDHRALVIGGSRGLGEAFAKVLAAGGAQVHLTYRDGVVDAERVATQIGGTASRYDVLGGVLELPWTPTRVYYFATPKIRIARDEPFSPDDLRLLLDYYVLGLERTVRQVGACEVYAPSTVFLDGAERGTAAYTIAKAAMEELGRRLPELYPVTVSMPRLPRTATDQTASLIAIPCADPIEIALTQLVGGSPGPLP